MSMDYNGVQKLTKYSILIVAYMSHEHNHKHFEHFWTGSWKILDLAWNADIISQQVNVEEEFVTEHRHRNH